MIQLITGAKGKGKTKILLDKVNNAVEKAMGTIVYLDKTDKHAFELSNKVRLINVKSYLIENTDEFLGFISGIISQDHDLEAIYLDSFLNISHLENQDIDKLIPVFEKLKTLSDTFEVDLILSVSRDSHDLPESIQEFISVSL
ncbi:MAG: twitching motility protein PilT [Clostridiales bacterium]|nr:twitching motility protein PilT [Clostridiales bacterium]